MKKIVMIIFAVMGLVGCGHSAVNNELTGQVKKVVQVTPLLCGNRTEADISLGVMRNGVGSVSHEDFIGVVTSPEVAQTLKKAAETGELVKISYDTWRLTFCWNDDHEITGAQIIQ